MADDDENKSTQHLVGLEVILMTIWDLFKHAPRGGAETDEPVGSRYIQISDTMADTVVESIDKLLDAGRVSAADLRTNPNDDMKH